VQRVRLKATYSDAIWRMEKLNLISLAAILCLLLASHSEFSKIPRSRYEKSQDLTKIPKYSENTTTARQRLQADCTGGSTDMDEVPDAVPPIHAVSFHVATDKDPSKFRSILATIYNQSQLAER